MENKLEVELINAQLLDFKLDNGDLIKGLKIFYHDSVIKDNMITGEVVETYFSFEKMSDYEEKYKQLKEYYLNCKRNGVVPYITMWYSIKSIKSKPTITKIEFKSK